jgi:hypothetical protein
MAATESRAAMIAGWLDVYLREPFPTGKAFLDLDSLIGEIQIELMDVAVVPQRWSGADGCDFDGYDQALVKPWEAALHRARARCVAVIREEFLQAAAEFAPLQKRWLAQGREVAATTSEPVR